MAKNTSETRDGATRAAAEAAARQYVLANGGNWRKLPGNVRADLIRNMMLELDPNGAGSSSELGQYGLAVTKQPEFGDPADDIIDGEIVEDVVPVSGVQGKRWKLPQPWQKNTNPGNSARVEDQAPVVEARLDLDQPIFTKGFVAGLFDPRTKSIVMARDPLGRAVPFNSLNERDKQRTFVELTSALNIKPGNYTGAELVMKIHSLLAKSQVTTIVLVGGEDTVHIEIPELQRELWQALYPVYGSMNRNITHAAVIAILTQPKFFGPQR